MLIRSKVAISDCSVAYPAFMYVHRRSTEIFVVVVTGCRPRSGSVVGSRRISHGCCARALLGEHAQHMYIDLIRDLLIEPFCCAKVLE